MRDQVKVPIGNKVYCPVIEELQNLKRCERCPYHDLMTETCIYDQPIETISGI